MESSPAPSTSTGRSPTVSQEDEKKFMENTFGNGFSQLNKSYIKPRIMKDNENFRNPRISISTAAEIDNVISDVKILSPSTSTLKSSIKDKINSINKGKFFIATTLIDSTIPTESTSSDTTLEDMDYADNVADTIMYHGDPVNECGEPKPDDEDPTFPRLLTFLNEVMKNSEESIANQVETIAKMEEENKKLNRDIEILTKLLERGKKKSSV